MNNPDDNFFVSFCITTMRLFLRRSVHHSVILIIKLQIALLHPFLTHTQV